MMYANYGSHNQSMLFSIYMFLQKYNSNVQTAFYCQEEERTNACVIIVSPVPLWLAAALAFQNVGGPPSSGGGGFPPLFGMRRCHLAFSAPIKAAVNK